MEFDGRGGGACEGGSGAGIESRCSAEFVAEADVTGLGGSEVGVPVVVHDPAEDEAGGAVVEGFLVFTEVEVVELEEGSVGASEGDADFVVVHC